MSMRRHGRKHSRQASVDFPKYLPLNSPQATESMPSTTLAPVIPSDYESDNQGYISDYPTVIAPVSRTREELNLAVLKNINADISDILSIAPFVTLYDWAPGEEPGSESGWQKTPTVGSLFICQLRPGEYGEERYQALLLNRGGDKNFTAELRQSEESTIEIQGDFVIVMRQDKGRPMELNALFIYAAEGTSTAASRTANGELMVALAEAAKMSRQAAENQAQQKDVRSNTMDVSQLQALFSNSQIAETPPAPTPVAKSEQSIDLLALLQGKPRDAPQAQPVQSPATPTQQDYPQQRIVHPLPPKPPVTKDDPLRTQLLSHFMSAKPAQAPVAQTTQPSVDVNELFRKAGLIG